MDKKTALNQLNKYIYAHRGFHSKPEIPENSLSAFKRAAEEGFGMELDVHLTKDGKLAVIHDSSLWRTCGIDLYIEEITLEEAQLYFLEKSDEVIPELCEVLEVVGGKTPLLIELKVVDGNHKELTDAVMASLKDYHGFYFIESFSPSVVAYLRKKYPQVARGQLAGALNDTHDEIKKEKSKPHIDVDCVEYADTGLEGTFLDESLVEETENEIVLPWWKGFLLKNLWVNMKGKPDFVSYRYEDREVAAFKNFKGAKFLWTVTDYADMKECERKGIAAIFENFNPKDYE